MTNPNETETFSLSQGALDALFARTGEHLEAEHQRRQQAAEWPSQVEQMLAALARELVALRTRVDTVEAAARGG